MTRQESARCLAKIQAYIDRGEPEKAREWADRLVRWLIEERVIE